jgi:hypothetical protein
VSDCNGLDNNHSSQCLVVAVVLSRTEAGRKSWGSAHRIGSLGAALALIPEIAGSCAWSQRFWGRLVLVVVEEVEAAGNSRNTAATTEGVWEAWGTLEEG